MCSMNTRKSIFFSKTSVRIQLNDTKGVKSQSENRKLDEETLVSRKVYLFHTDFSPISTLQVTWTRNVSQVTTVAAIRRSTVVDLLSRSSNKIDSTPSCRNFTNKLDTKCISSCYSYHYQATNHVDLLNLSLIIIKPTLLDTDNNNFT